MSLALLNLKAEEARRTYYIKKTREKIIIDGRLNESSWRRAKIIKGFTRFLAPTKTPTYQTQARMLWDDKNLYIAFECEDPDIWSPKMERDGPLWKGEVVEVYIDPDGDGKNYKEIEVNPLNQVIDLNIPFAKDGRPGIPWKEGSKWNAQGLKTAVKVEGTVNNRQDRDKKWTVEIAIPLINFTTAPNIPPQPGDRWRLQLYRIDRSSTLKESKELSSWSPTPTFHVPENFGEIIFTE